MEDSPKMRTKSTGDNPENEEVQSKLTTALSVTSIGSRSSVRPARSTKVSKVSMTKATARDTRKLSKTTLTSPQLTPKVSLATIVTTNTRKQSLATTSAAAAELIDGQWKVQRKIGKGNFGTIFRMINTKDNKRVAAMKKEKLAATDQLKTEYHILKKLAGKKGFPRVYYYGTLDNNTYCCLVMDLLGHNLEEIYTKCGRRFTAKALTFLAVQLVRRFETIHSLGIVYRDVKPENFMLGVNTNRVHVVDFGLSKYYRDERGEHVCERYTGSVVGTQRYMSVGAHNCHEQSRRDDMEALGYLFVYFMRGRVPWSGIRMANISDCNRAVRDIKTYTPGEELCAGYPQEFLHFYNYVRKLDFYEEPRYEQITRLFKKVFVKLKLTNDGVFDWKYR